MKREDEGLQQLGKKTEYKMTYAPEVLETFENKHKDNDYWVQFNCPEFTSLCPITGQPDFAEIKIMYIPGERMVESKSLKLYLFSFRNHRGGGTVYPSWWHQHLSICQLRTARNKIRCPCRAAPFELSVTLSPIPLCDNILVRGRGIPK